MRILVGVKRQEADEDTSGVKRGEADENTSGGKEVRSR
jgi:hypothetical protein